MVVETQHAASLRVGTIAASSALPIIGFHTRGEEWVYRSAKA